MTEQNLYELQRLLERLGFSGRTAWQLEAYRETTATSFRIYDRREKEENNLLYVIHFEKDPSGDYRLDSYSLSFTHVEVPEVTIRGINTKGLEAALREVDRCYDRYLTQRWIEGKTRSEYDRVIRFIAATNAKLETLATLPRGEAVARLLMFKFWPQARYAQHFDDYALMKCLHVRTQRFNVSGENPVSANQSYHILKTDVMNEKNLEYLKDNLKYMGFGESLADGLEVQIKAGAPDFQLTFEAEINKKPFAALLNFRKSDNTDMYFFNSYHASLQRSNGDIMDQAFYLNKGKGVTVKEAYNLLEGRAVQKEMVNKEGQTYKAWLQIDFEKRDKNNNYEVKQFHEAYGYDLKEALSRFPIRDMKEPDLRDILLASLQKGNLQAVAFEKDGGAVRMFVEANPQYKTVNLFDSELKRVTKEALSRYQPVEQRKPVKEIKEGTSQGPSQGKCGKGKSEKKGEKNSESLLPKKRENTKKGLRMA